MQKYATVIRFVSSDEYWYGSVARQARKYFTCEAGANDGGGVNRQYPFTFTA